MGGRAGDEGQHTCEPRGLFWRRRSGGGGALEFADVEAGGVGHGCGVGAVVCDVLKDR